RAEQKRSPPHRNPASHRFLLYSHCAEVRIGGSEFEPEVQRNQAPQWVICRRSLVRRLQDRPPIENSEPNFCKGWVSAGPLPGMQFGKRPFCLWRGRGNMRRQPTDIIVGECRDGATMAAAVHAAISGHVLTTTVHANDVALTMQRIVSLCPPGERENLVSAVAQSLRLVINQRLAFSTDGKRTALREFLVFDKELRTQFLETDPR